MSAKLWMRWLSIIALVFVGLSFLWEIWNFVSGKVANFDSTEITVLILSIVAVIISFKKK